LITYSNTKSLYKLLEIHVPVTYHKNSTKLDLDILPLQYLLSHNSGAPILQTHQANCR